MIDFLIGDMVFSLIGRVCLFVRFRSKYKVRKELIAKYDNSFRMAGATLIWLLVAWVLLIGISIGLIGILIAIFYGMVTNLF